MNTESTYSYTENTSDFELLNEPVATYGPSRIALIRRGIKLDNVPKME